MNILIAGASGLVGKELVRSLSLTGKHKIRILTRSRAEYDKELSFPVEVFEWEPTKGYIDPKAIDDVDIVINLAGAGIADKRWSEARKKLIIDSRVMATKVLLNEIKRTGRTPKKFINASAIGLYGSTGELDIDENSASGSDFLAETCIAWENALLKEDIEGMSSYILRLGLVLSSKGGALAKMLPAFKLGIAGKIASGSQYMSWIHIDDLVKQFEHIINNDCKDKIYNAVAPKAASNTQFTKTLGKVLKRPTMIPLPEVAAKVILGELSVLVTQGQKVIPRNFLDLDFPFKHPNLEDALRDLLKSELKGEKIFHVYQWINRTPEEIFDFFSDEKNLELITPESLEFKVVRKSTEAIEQDTFIDYKIKIHGIPCKWKTHISDFQKNITFVDEQMIGPYKNWKHRHNFIPLNGGTLIEDYIEYKVPLGAIGNLITGSFIRKDITKIFSYRQKVIARTFS